MSYRSVDSYDFSSVDSFTGTDHVAGTVSHYRAGQFSNGSYSFGSIVLSDSGDQS
jgi:hypothetical protein